MCKRCMVECTGLRSGKGGGIISKIMGRRACKHSKRCSCDYCLDYRRDNKYADYGLFLGDREIERKYNE